MANYKDREALLHGYITGQRNQDPTYLAEQYTEEELKSLLDTADYEQWVPPDDPYKGQYDEILARAAKLKPRKIRKWSALEDKFLRSTYMHLTDATVALALNVPVTIVLARRRVLGLRKKLHSHLELVIWCERDAFEKDMQEQTLTKARPDVEL